MRMPGIPGHGFFTYLVSVLRPETNDLIKKREERGGAKIQRLWYKKLKFPEVFYTEALKKNAITEETPAFFSPCESNL